MPPEFITNRRYDPSNEAVRSIGVVIYEMIYGRRPYRDYKNYSDVIAGLPNLDNISEGKVFFQTFGLIQPLARSSRAFCSCGARLHESIQ